MKKALVLGVVSGLFISIAACAYPQNAYAKDKTISVNGNVYVLEGKDDGFAYSGQDSKKTTKTNTYGTLSLVGGLNEMDDQNGVSAYDVSGNIDAMTGEDRSVVTFLYTYDNSLLNADEAKTWKLYSDGSKKIGDLELDKKVGKGTIVVQSSFDGKTWNTDLVKNDVFSATPQNDSASLYETTINQMVNGCYYKVIVAYETRKQDGKNKLGPIPVETTAKYQYQEHVEVYEFYLCNETESAKAADIDDPNTYNLGSTPVNTGNHNGYSKKNAIGDKDVHSGWTIGRFYINGFSDKPHFYPGDEKTKENPVFLKKLNDKVTLWFHLNESNLNSLNGNDDLSIVADEKGSDTDLGVSGKNFKRGAMIIKFTDYQNTTTTNVYVDYLAAAATTSADTKVQLFEEGDYEVALDYMIKDSSPLAWKIPKPAQYSSYRITFKFSIRNSNCMVYPMDLKTGGELQTYYTENGFRLDLARSRYLNLEIKKKTLTSGGLSLREDDVASDLEEFSAEGIYEITVGNPTTGKNNTQTIYVGTNNLLKAYVKYAGKYSITDLQDMQEEGYEFGSDGTLVEPEIVLEPEVEPEVEEESDTESKSFFDRLFSR